MIVQESDILLAALDRRLQVDSVLAVDPLAPVSRGSGTPSSAAGSNFASATAANAQNTATPLTTRLPLGQLITARVVEVPQPDHVIAEVGNLRIDLAWPKGNGIAQPGRDIGLRVLAHEPMLLFQSEPLDAAGSSGDGIDPEAAARWSSDAMHLQPPGATPGRGAGPVRFDAPILDIEIVPIDKNGPAVADDWQPGVPRPSSNAVVSSGPARIALDDVIVARSTAVVDGIDAPLIPRAIDDGSRIPTTFMPLVLHGPAWPGQPMELVVRRERKDEAFDNPALDHWCGEVLIDLPNLGRVAGHLAFSMQGLRLRLEGDDAEAVDAMTAHATELAHALAVANLRVSALSVGCPAADTRRPTPEPSAPGPATFTSSRDG